MSRKMRLRRLEQRTTCSSMPTMIFVMSASRSDEELTGVSFADVSLDRLLGESVEVLKGRAAEVHKAYPAPGLIAWMRYRGDES